MVSVAIEQLAEHSEIISTELNAGHTLTLSEGGKRIGEIVPTKPEPIEGRRKAAEARFSAFMEKGLNLGGRALTRSEIYDDAQEPRQASTERKTQFPAKAWNSEAERLAEIDRVMAKMKKGYDLGGFKITDRDALYDRD